MVHCDEPEGESMFLEQGFAIHLIGQKYFPRSYLVDRKIFHLPICAFRTAEGDLVGLLGHSRFLEERFHGDALPVTMDGKKTRADQEDFLPQRGG